MAGRERQIINPSIAIRASVVGVLLFVVALAVLTYLLPPQSVHTSGRNYGYEYSGAKSSSVAFNTSSDASDSMLLFGSSELSTPASTVPQVPSVVFGEHNYGINLTYIGEAYDQSLWHAIAAGAYSNYVENRKVALIVSLGWFDDGGIDNETFGLRFSYSLYRAFCDNDAISSASKAYLAKRLSEQGIDAATINAGMRTLPADYINDALFAAMDDLKIRKELVSVREGGIEMIDYGSEAPDAIDFDALKAQAVADAAAMSTNNDLGIDDRFYSNTLASQIDRLKDAHADETYTLTPEYNDFNFFLKVCREVGFEPLVIISPVHGEFYDYEGISKDVRADCYSRVVEICNKHGVSYADFSDREYEKYFLHDIVHFGGPGWVAVEEAIYDYANE